MRDDATSHHIGAVTNARCIVANGGGSDAKFCR